MHRREPGMAVGEPVLVCGRGCSNGGHVRDQHVLLPDGALPSVAPCMLVWWNAQGAGSLALLQVYRMAMRLPLG